MIAGLMLLVICLVLSEKRLTIPLVAVTPSSSQEEEKLCGFNTTRASAAEKHLLVTSISNLGLSESTQWRQWITVGDVREERVLEVVQVTRGMSFPGNHYCFSIRANLWVNGLRVAIPAPTPDKLVLPWKDTPTVLSTLRTQIAGSLRVTP